MNAIADFDDIIGRGSVLNGQTLGGRTIAEADIQVVAVPTITVGVAEFEDDIAGILYDTRALSHEIAICIQSESQRQLLGRGAVGIDGDVEYTSGDSRRIECSNFKGVVFKADIVTR